MIKLVRFAVLLTFMSISIAAVPGSADESPVLPPNAKPQLVLETGAGEGPAWDPKLGVLFSGGGHIQRWSRGGELQVFRRNAGTNGLLFDRRGRLLACEPVSRRVTRRSPSGEIQVLAERYQGKRFNQPNDITVDSRGRVFFSDPKYGSREGMEMVDRQGRKVEGVYRIDPDGKLSRIITHEVDRPNGLVVTVDDRYLFVADNNNNEVGGARKLWRFRFRSDGELDLSSRKLIYDWAKSRGPDGMVLDQKGRLYVAGGLNRLNLPAENNNNKGGVYVFSSEGKLLEFIPIPRDEVTNCTFGGDDLKTLFITAGGTLWSVRTTTAGRMPWPK